MEMEELKNEFILDCKVRNLAPRTVRNYERQLSCFLRFLKEAQKVEDLEGLKSVHIKQFRKTAAASMGTRKACSGD